jgi:hypothetical protein
MKLSSYKAEISYESFPFLFGFFFFFDTWYTILYNKILLDWHFRETAYFVDPRLPISSIISGAQNMI